jgi:hypothetical protein
MVLEFLKKPLYSLVDESTKEVKEEVRGVKERFDKEKA